MFRQLMVPPDGSDFAEHALPVAIAIGRRWGAALELVHVRCPIVPAGLGVHPPLRSELGDSPEYDYLASIPARIPDGITATTTLLDGPAIAPALFTYARDRSTDLIVMTTHGRGGLARAWLGSMAERVVRAAETPVLLIRPDDDPPEAEMAELFRRILIPLDDCTRTEAILAPALALGALADATYTLLHVITPSTRGEHYHDRRERGEPEAIEEAQATAELRRAAARLQLGPDQVATVVLRHRSLAWAILEHAQAFDLIAMATHGRGSVGRFFLGSVADKVLRGARLPVLVGHASRAQGGR